MGEKREGEGEGQRRREREREGRKERYMNLHCLYYKIKVPSQPSTVDSRHSHSQCRP